MKEKRTDKPHAQNTSVKNKPIPEPEARGTFQLLMPHVVALLIFVVITVLYFSPMLLDNKVISESDIIQNKGMAKEITDFRAQTGKEALWTNSMFGGMPAFQISVLYHGNLLQYVDKIMSLGFPHPSELLFIALLGFYILLVVLGISPWLAIAGAIGYGLCSFNLILLQAGHTSELHAIGLLPLSVAGLLLLRQGKYLWGTVLTAVGLSLQINANHLQITYYLFLLLVVFGIVELVYSIMEKNFRNLLISGCILAVCGVFSIVTNLSMLWSTYEYAPATIRGPSELTSNKQSSGGLDKDYAMQWSYGKMETFTLLIPNFYGGSSTEDVGVKSHIADELRKLNLPEQQVQNFVSQIPAYWGDVPFTSGPVYVGAIICFLFLMGMFLVKERWKWWVLSASLLAVFLAWGRNFAFFNDFMFSYFPGYNKFRTPSMSLVLTSFSFSFLALVFVQHLLKGDYDKSEVKKYLLRSLIIVGGLCLLFAVLGGSFFSFSSPNDSEFSSQMLQASGNNKDFAERMLEALKSDRASLLRADAFRSLVFILLAGGLIWLFIGDRVNKNIFMGGLIVLIFVDMFSVGKRYLNDANFVSKNDYDKYFEPTQVDQLIQKETSKDYRVFNLATNTFNDSRTSYYHKSIGGYHAAKLRRYQDIIEHQLTRSDSTRKSPYPFNKSVVDMLNTKYIIFKAGNNEQVAPNTGALDNAWFVSEMKMVNNADEEMNALNDFNPAQTVIVDKRFSSQLNGFTPSADSSATIALQTYAPNDLVYKSKSSKENVAVFSEIYYQPGWDSFIDGKKTDHFRCNYILRGMRIPAGEHTIEFKFEPSSYYTGEKAAMAGSGLILLLLIGAVAREIMNRRKQVA